MFFYLSHVQVFSCAISSILRLKSPCNCFSSLFSFIVFVVFRSGLILPRLVLTAEICFSFAFFFLMRFTSPCINTSTMLLWRLFSRFYIWYSLFMSSFGCKSLFIGINFVCLLVNWSAFLLWIFQERSRISYKGYCTGVYPFDEVSAAELGFQKFSRFSESLFLFFSFISASLMLYASNIPKYLQVIFSPSDLILSWSNNFFSTIICLFLLYILTFSHFSTPNSIPISRLYILIICIRVSNFFSFFCKQLDIVHVHYVINL